MRFSDAAKVGVTVLVALGVLVWATFFLRGNLGKSGTYVQDVSFKNAQGIQRGALVRVRGVDLGQVEGVGLGSDGDARVALRMREAYRIQPRDAIRIVGALVGFGQPYIEITPGGRKTAIAGPVLSGEVGADTDQLLARGNELLVNLNELSTKMNRLAGSLNQFAENPEVRRSLIRTTTNFERVSDEGVGIAKNMRSMTARADHLMAQFDASAGSLDRTLKRAEGVMTSLRTTADESRSLVRDTRGVVASSAELVRNTNEVMTGAGGLVTETRSALTENRQKLTQLFEGLNGSLKQLDATLAEARSFVADPQMRADLQATSRNIRDATETLRKVTQDVQGLTGDPKVQDDLRATLAGLRDATEQASGVFRRVRDVLGSEGGPAKGVGQRIAGTDFRLDATRTFESERTRVDLDATIPWSDRTFYRLGLFDFGENTRFNAQLGQRVRPGLWARYGLRASRLGVGIDVGDRSRPSFSFDLYGVNRTRGDLRANLPVTSFLDLTAGLDNLFQRPDPIIGIRLHK